MRRTAGTMILVFLAAVTVAGADSLTSRGSSNVLLDAPTKAKRVDADFLVAVASVLEDELAGSCTLEATLGGDPRKGVKGTFDAVLVDAITGNTISVLAHQSGKTKKDGTLTVDYPIPRRANFAQLVALVVDVSLRGGKKLTGAELSCTLVDETP